MRTLYAMPLLLTIVAAASNATAQKRYFVDEVTDFTDNGCQNLTDQNDVTSSLKTAMDTDSWTGIRFANSGAFPQDFFESCSPNYGAVGLDSSCADNKTLAVYAGHGSPWGFHFGFPHSGVCDVDFNSNMRLGSMNGSKAAYLMMLTSNGASDVGMLGGQWARQVFGFVLSPFISSNRPRDFFNATSTTVNSVAWLNTMAGLTPKVFSFSASSTGCWNVHGAAKLKGNIFVSPRTGGPSCNQGQPLYFWCSTEAN